MKNVALLLLLSTLSFSGFSQDSLQLDKKPLLLIQTGIGLEWFGENLKSSSLSIERPFTPFVHVGLQSNFYYPKYINYYGSVEFLEGYELGVFCKYFLHGRFSGKRTGLYLGPEIRFTKHKFRIQNDIFFPPLPQTPFLYADNTKLKVALRWGVQRQMGHVVLEIACPFGLSFVSSNADTYYLEEGMQFVMMPMFQLGYAF
ncbi:MAG: hypothetical protein JNN28_18025 [Saprospiraceae bacterium]|nr:hypothetical protein [Saprospiraceae bacterium]